MRIIMLRHGESIGNVDESAFCRIPDHAMELTDIGREQSIRAGGLLRQILGDSRVEVYVSPYVRTRQTTELLALGTSVIGIREEPRLREQDWGNLQDPQEQARQHAERNAFGHFFYRLRSGESGADVYDRVTGFLGAVLQGRPPGFTPTGAEQLTPAVPAQGSPADRTMLFVTHGLTMRLACMSLMGWTVAEFESLSNPANADFRVLDRGTDGRWTLDRPFDHWR